MTDREPTLPEQSARRVVQFGRDPLGFLDGLRRTEPGLVDAELPVGPTLTFVTDPALIQQVLVDDDARYRRPEIRSGRSVQLTEAGLIDSEGPLWEAQRARLGSLFAPERLEAYADTIAAVFDTVTADWADGDTIDLYDAMAELTVRVISRTLFSRRLSDAPVRNANRAERDRWTLR